MARRARGVARLRPHMAGPLQAGSRHPRGLWDGKRHIDSDIATVRSTGGARATRSGTRIQRQGRRGGMAVRDATPAGTVATAGGEGCAEGDGGDGGGSRARLRDAAREAVLQCADPE